MAIVRIIIGFLLAVIAATLAGAALQTLAVGSSLAGAGAAIDLPTRLDMAAADVAGLAPSYGPVIAIGFAVAFAVAALARRALKTAAIIAYPLAGGVAIAVALILMPVFLDLGGLVPLAGTRGVFGFALQCAAGAFGGLVFALIAVRKQA